VAGVLDQVHRRVIEELRDLGGERWGQVAILLTEDDRHRDLEGAQCAARDERILLVQRLVETCTPAAHGVDGIGLIGVAEELRQDRTSGHTLRVVGIEVPLRFIERGESVILHGPVGVGKTFIAQALGHQACRHGHSVAFTKTSRLLADLAGGHADHTWATRLRRWAKPDLVILDDFAMRDFAPTQADDLYELLTERAGRPLVLTANRRPEDWYPRFPNPVVAESVLDRLINTAHHVHMDGRSFRPNKRPGRARDQKGAAND
jgi:hypothetical protein